MLLYGDVGTKNGSSSGMLNHHVVMLLLNDTYKGCWCFVSPRWPALHLLVQNCAVHVRCASNSDCGGLPANRCHNRHGDDFRCHPGQEDGANMNRLRHGTPFDEQRARRPGGMSSWAVPMPTLGDCPSSGQRLPRGLSDVKPSDSDF